MCENYYEKNEKTKNFIDRMPVPAMFSRLIVCGESIGQC